MYVVFSLVIGLGPFSINIKTLTEKKNKNKSVYSWLSSPINYSKANDGVI